MTRIFVQRGSTGSSSNQSRLSQPSSSSAPIQHLLTPLEEEVQDQDCCASGDDKTVKNDEILSEIASDEFVGKEGAGNDDVNSGMVMKELGVLQIRERLDLDDNDRSSIGPLQIISGGSYPPPPPVPPPKPSAANLSSRTVSSGSNAVRIGTSRRAVSWPVVSTRTSPSGSRPSSPRSYGEAEGYNSADEQSPCFGSSFDDAERERQFELDIRRAKGLEVKRMLEDGNCLFRAVADQVYGDTEAYDLIRQMCIDYMERERDHFNEFITEGFTSYCKRKRRDKVYGNNVEIQALSEMYNRPIHIYSYTTEPINIFQGNYDTDTPPIRLSYHHGNHYNSLVDPRRLTIGAGLGFSSLQGANIDKDQVKAAIRAQQDQQIDNALLAEGRFYSDLELTEKEIERMVMEASRAEYFADDKFKHRLSLRESSTSSTEPSSRKALIDQGLYCSLRQLLEVGFFHADPHPGNLVATQDGSLAYFDFGMMGDIPRHYRVGLIQVLVHFVNRDYLGLANDFLSLGFIPEGVDIQSVSDALRASFVSGTGQSQDFQGIMSQLYDIMYEFNFSLPPDYALVMRALGSLEGTAKALDPDFKVVESAYPFVIGRLLADPSPDMRKILRELLIRNDGSIRWNRLERLIAAISEQVSESAEEPIDSPTTNASNISGWKSFDMHAVVAATEDLFHFILSEKGWRVRVFLVRDITKAADVFLREEALRCIFDEKLGDRETSEFEGHSMIIRMANGFRSLLRAVKMAPEVWTAMLLRMALKPEVHRFTADVICALAMHSVWKIPEASWLCISRLLHKLERNYRF